MPHIFELAPSARAKCRGCGGAIAKGELRFGERLPNPFATGENAENVEMIRHFSPALTETDAAEIAAALVPA